MLGAAGNVARNVAALGRRGAAVGMAGEDAAADELAALLRAEPRLHDTWCATLRGPLR
jgi:D-beta-D-heptose 7-phosphate kinase/D-beta-D-heptose 1-phosphate adenosyltransferase